VAAWVRTVEDLKAMPISDDVRNAYEEVLAVFPSAVRHCSWACLDHGDADTKRSRMGRTGAFSLQGELSVPMRFKHG